MKRYLFAPATVIIAAALHASPARTETGIADLSFLAQSAMQCAHDPNLEDWRQQIGERLSRDGADWPRFLDGLARTDSAFAALSAESKAFYCGIFVKAFSLGEVRTAP
ncbi:MAG: hypothetical protein H6878_05350 [Rhodobiaceae bacterium]|nr:hypothetical protein [Rhodobiaceae bacterium]